MIEEIATVTRIADGQAWIKSQASSSCGGCAKQTACSTAMLSKLLPQREFAVDCDLSLRVGDQVRVAIDDSHLILTSIIMYLFPLLAMFGGIALAQGLLPAAVAAQWLPEIALAALILTFWAIHLCQGLLLLYFCFRPQIVGKL